MFQQDTSEEGTVFYITTNKIGMICKELETKKRSDFDVYFQKNLLKIKEMGIEMKYQFKVEANGDIVLYRMH